jgi:hypothetical protein
MEKPFRDVQCDGCDGRDDELQSFSKGGAVLSPEMREGATGRQHRECKRDKVQRRPEPGGAPAPRSCRTPTTDLTEQSLRCLRLAFRYLGRGYLQEPACSQPRANWKGCYLIFSEPDFWFRN